MALSTTEEQPLSDDRLRARLASPLLQAGNPSAVAGQSWGFLGVELKPAAWRKFSQQPREPGWSSKPNQGEPSPPPQKKRVGSYLPTESARMAEEAFVLREEKSLANSSEPTLSTVDVPDFIPAPSQSQGSQGASHPPV